MFKYCKIFLAGEI